jgi:hypothetical protein
MEWKTAEKLRMKETKQREEEGKDRKALEFVISFY